MLAALHLLTRRLFPVAFEWAASRTRSWSSAA